MTRAQVTSRLGVFADIFWKMSSSGLAPFSSRENISAQGKVDGPCIKPGQRVVLGVLTENDHHRKILVWL